MKAKNTTGQNQAQLPTLKSWGFGGQDNDLLQVAGGADFEAAVSMAADLVVGVEGLLGRLDYAVNHLEPSPTLGELRALALISGAAGALLSSARSALINARETDQ
ncbi:hypothetical protein PSCICO_46950 [Pseudomonas cichorii]|uniref:hypothetical protein n=1 Tax=Pseudomonas cichorii TaxID=36746 RepID=UPI00190FF74D|nr:hypothetical protein [Pseudomonas cichorii]GFM89296.1 hypothetical protein PSCICO_46950 [Pseudomonas cichorii]